MAQTRFQHRPLHIAMGIHSDIGDRQNPESHGGMILRIRAFRQDEVIQQPALQAGGGIFASQEAIDGGVHFELGGGVRGLG